MTGLSLILEASGLNGLKYFQVVIRVSLMSLSAFTCQVITKDKDIKRHCYLNVS